MIEYLKKQLLSIISICFLVLLFSGANAFAVTNLTGGTARYSGNGNNYTLTLNGQCSIDNTINTGSDTTWPSGDGKPATNNTNNYLSQVIINGTVTFTGGSAVDNSQGFGKYVTKVGLLIQRPTAGMTTETYNCTVSGSGTLQVQNSGDETIAPIFIEGKATSTAATPAELSATINNGLKVIAGTPGLSYDNGCYLAVGVEGQSTLNITGNGTSITGLPAVMAIAQQADQGSYVTANVIIENGAVCQTSSNYVGYNGATPSKLAVIRTQGQDKGKANFTVQNGGTVNGAGNWGSRNSANYAAGFYGANPTGSITVQNGGIVTGYSGIVARTGNVTVTDGTVEGLGPVPDIAGTAKGSQKGNGSGIVLAGSTDGTYTSKPIKVNVSDSSVSSANGSALSSYKDSSNNPTTGSTVDVKDSNLTGKTVPNVQIQGNEAPLSGWADDKTVVTITDPDTLEDPDTANDILEIYGTTGKTLFQVGDQFTASYDEAKSLETPSNPITVVAGDDLANQDVGDLTPGQIFGASLTADEELVYYNISQSVLNASTSLTPSDQDGPLTLSVTGTNAQYYSTSNIGPENFNWQIQAVPVTTSSSSPRTFSSTAGEWTEVGNPIFSQNNNYQTTKGTRINYSEPYSDWALEYDYVLTEPTTTNRDGLGSFSYSNLRLVYAGGVALPDGTGTNSSSQLAEGAYQLSASPQNLTGAYNTNTNNINPSVRFVINSSNTTKATITTADYQQVASPYTINLTNGRTAQFAYTRSITRNGQALDNLEGGGTPDWSLKLTGSNDPVSNYASVTQNGLVTIYRAIPQGSYLQLNLSVDGVPANAIYITTTGQLSYSGVTGIEPIYSPLYLYQDNDYNLAGNLITVPTGQPIIGVGSLTLTSDNPDIYIQNRSGQFNAIPLTSNATTANITATWTDADGKEYSTVFPITFVSQEVEATGITAEETLSFNLENVATANVNARLTPENNTENPALSAFNYATSDSSVAVVDSYGNVTPVGVGTCTITTTYSGVDGSAVTEVTVTEAPAQATDITLAPSVVYLAPEGTTGGTTSAEITATVTPEEVEASSVTWTVSSDGITLAQTSGLTNTVTATDEPGTYTVTASVPGPDDTTLTATTTVEVTAEDIVIDPLKTTITADSPDFYTVTVAPVANPAVDGSDASNIQKVSIFTWSNEGQTDMDCKIVEKGADGTYSYTFPVNNTPVNNYYDNASDITVQAYASTEAGSEGNMIMNTTWNYADCGWTEGVIVTPYVQDTGFITPSVGNDVTAGTTGQARQMEGVRLSSQYEGLDLVYDVHVQDIGWQEEVGTGVYAGTMGANLQIEAIHIKLAGPNASNYTIQYRAHVQDIGWQDWVSAGEEAGTTGQGLQMEALEVRITPVNS